MFVDGPFGKCYATSMQKPRITLIKRLALIKVLFVLTLTAAILAVPSCDLANSLDPEEDTTEEDTTKEDTTEEDTTEEDTTEEDSTEETALQNAVLHSTVQGNSSLGSSDAAVSTQSFKSTNGSVQSLALEDDLVLDYKSPYLWTGDDGLSRKDVLANPVASVPIASFEITADIYLHSSAATEPATLMSWGGDPDAEPMVDLMSATLSETKQGEQANLKALKYETVYFQLNSAGEVLTPEGENPLELTQVLPFFIDTSNQVTVFSTFVDTPFVTYLEAPDYDFDARNYQTLIAADVTDQVSHLGEWPGTAPLTKEYFDAAAGLSTDDPGPGVGPTLFMPLPEAIDLTDAADASEITFRIEILFDELLTEYDYEHDSPYWEGNRFFFLSPFRSYTDADGHTYYGPLPLRMTYNVEG